MEPMPDEEREIRAARNQTIFRAVNERMRTLNEAIRGMSDLSTIACECANINCVEQLDIAPGDYEAVRASPRRFVVLPGHVYPDIEQVVEQAEGFVVVEKLAQAGETAERLAFETD
jgi:5-bromo-4-chloroindolyl phosphate hydrolysis protein